LNSIYQIVNQDKTLNKDGYIYGISAAAAI
jgi:hypothetical protein